MKKSAREHHRQSKKSKRLASRLMWLGVGALVVGLGYLGLQTSGVAYDEADIGVVDFSSLNSNQKLEALRAANRSRCNCGCGMNTAQCVSTDSTCPIRTDNIQKIRDMVRDARQSS
jgi:hypothetical protein